MLREKKIGGGGVGERTYQVASVSTDIATFMITAKQYCMTC